MNFFIIHSRKIVGIFLLKGDFIVHLSKRALPNTFGKKTNSLNAKITSQPFYVKECSYSNDRKYSVGMQNDYSDFILLYNISGIARFDKHQTSHFLHPHYIVVSACNTPMTFLRAGKEWSFIYVIISGNHAKQFYNTIRTMNNIYIANPMSYLIDYFIDLYNLKYSEDMLPNIESGLLIHSIMVQLYKLTQDIAATKSILPYRKAS